ncbi:MAG: TetR/AcrR family transcriptional regulator [Bacilli bacterium]|nr:TetR/AcrR family transcriptional regulator [Bacilli bacterium]MBN2877882.1 TetR/AcrR family transcriptional regulator [Bacilli bacterium]
MNEREANKEVRYKEILTAGLDLLVENGYAAFKIRDLAKRLNISVGLFFHYFESKEDFYKTLIKIGISSPMDLVGQILEKGTPLDIFTMMANQIFDMIARDKFTAKMFLLMHQTAINGDVPESVKAMFFDFDTISPLVPVVRKGQDEGTIKSGNPKTLILTYWAAINGMAEFYINGDCEILPMGEWLSDILARH